MSDMRRHRSVFDQHQKTSLELPRLRDRWRSHILIKAEQPLRAAGVLRGVVRDLAGDLRRASATAVVDVDPQSLS